MTISNHRLNSVVLTAAAVALGALMIAGSAHAVCNHTDAAVSASDTAFWGARENSTVTDLHCNSTFNLVYLPLIMNLTDGDSFLFLESFGSSWSDRGEFDPCNHNYEWAKITNAGQLILAAPLISGFPADDRPFHDSGDYLYLMYGSPTDWHGYFYHSVEDSIPGAVMRYDYRVLTDNVVRSTCLAYDANTSPLFASLPYRAGSLMHEGWHAWQHEHGQSVAHDADRSTTGEYRPNGLGVCPADRQCDWYHPHEKGSFASGDLIRGEHSVIQVEYEFYCDIAQYAADWIPQVVREAAAAAAKSKYANSFANYPPIYCGNTRPLKFWAKDPIQPLVKPECSWATTGPGDPTRSTYTDCSHSNSCATNQTCDTDGCCRLKCNGKPQCWPGTWPGDFNAGSCSVDGCNLDTRCCEASPPECPSMISYSLTPNPPSPIGSATGVAYVTDITAVSWDSTHCNYHGIKHEDGTGGTSQSGYDFTLPRLPHCASGTPCVPASTAGYSCACDTTTGCCIAPPTTSPPPTCTTGAEQCQPGSTCSSGGCDLTTGCCSPPPTNCAPTASRVLANAPPSSGCGGQTYVPQANLTGWDATRCYYTGTECTISICAGSVGQSCSGSYSFYEGRGP